MKPLFAAALSALAAGMCQAGPAEKAIVAAMKLSEQPNYSWTTSVIDDARSYELEGKTTEGGCTWMRLPMVKRIAQRLGRESDTQIEAVFRGGSACVLRTNRGWQTLKELPKRHRDWNDEVEFWPIPAPSSAGGLWGRGVVRPHDPLDPFPMILHSMSVGADSDARPYSNAQFALSHPHEELAVIVSSHSSFKVEGDTVSGALSELGAQLLLVREGQDHLYPLAAAGLFKFLMKEGVVVKYFLRLEGILLVERRKVHVRQASSTTIKDIGTTRLEIPEEARRKLAQAW